jgi:hypothetical protein
MTAISSTFHRPTSHGRGSRHEAHVLWRDIGIAVALALVVLTTTLLETRGTSSGIQTGDGRPGIENWQQPRGWEDSVPLDLLPLTVLAPDTSS